MVAEWSRAPAISSREQDDVGLSPSPTKIPFSDENFLNNSRVDHMNTKLTFHYERFGDLQQRKSRM